MANAMKDDEEMELQKEKEHYLILMVLLTRGSLRIILSMVRVKRYSMINLAILEIFIKEK